KLFHNTRFVFLTSPLHLTDKTNFIISRVITAVLWILTVFILFNVWGIGLGGVWAILVSIITIIGVGFIATWAMTSNFTASFFLLLWRPVHVGQNVLALPRKLQWRRAGRN